MLQLHAIRYPIQTAGADETVDGVGSVNWIRDDSWLLPTKKSEIEHVRAGFYLHRYLQRALPVQRLLINE